MSFTGATINKMDGGLSRNSSSDRTICLLAGMTLVGNLQYNTAYRLTDINAIEALGINESNDNLKGEQTYYHLSEMFRLAPESIFYLVPVDKASTLASLNTNAELKTAIRSIENINVIGVAGINSLATKALEDATHVQLWVESFAKEHLYIDGVFVEGVGAEDISYDDLRTLNCQNVSYVIAQDPAIATLNEAYKYRASVGTVLGMVAVRKVHEDLGSVNIEEKPRNRRGEDNYSLSDANLGRWLSANLSDGTSFTSMTDAAQKDLTAKGWIYAGAFANYSGFYLNGCPTAVTKDSDYAYFNFNCIWNKAARIIRNTLIPRVRSKVPTDPTTGELKSTWVGGCESTVNANLDVMVSAGNIEDKEIYINPAQAIGEDTPLNVKAKLVVGRIVHEFDVDLGLTNNL